ncbi:MAG: sigma-70 family RNA polymerase sigma factor [Caldisericaceae bacterium]|nr:sigma-70 family RNA polymerase sigma factor [Caldisericaceae bacterium]
MTPEGEVKSIVRRHIAKLPEKERAAVVKVFLENKTIYLAAKELKITRHTLKYRLKKAKNAMRKSITEEIGIEKIEELLKEM